MSSLLSLCEAPVGKQLCVQRLGLTPDVCTRLREMGFCENSVVRCISRNGVCLICEVSNTRVGFNTALAEDILVSQFE